MIIAIGWVLCAAGMAFILIAALGLVRLPDALSRQHAATKAATVAVILIAAGVTLVVQDPAWSGRLLVILLFLFLTLPLSSYTLGRAAYRESKQAETESH